MDFYKEFSSNTLAPSGNQSFFLSDNLPIKARSFYKVFAGGKYNYSLMFSNIIDSTFADGSHSQKNYCCKEWTIKNATVGLVGGDTKDLSNPILANKTQLKFNGKTEKTVGYKEIFWCDAFPFEAKKDDYICLEIEFFGTEIPYFEEILIPTYVKEGEKWISNNKTPLCAMLGCDRKVEKKVGFLGDSITEGIGTGNNSYAWWCAKIAEFVGEKHSFWDLGIGFGRIDDVATDEMWLSKAKKLDIVTLCMGVNDISQGFDTDSVINNIEKTVDILIENGVRAILFTVPPFDWQGDKINKWKRVNDYINTELSKKAEIFDTVSVWGMDKPNENISRFGGHPNEEGCLKLAEKFVKEIKL